MIGNPDACPACLAPVPAGAFACAMCLLAVRPEGGRLVPVYPEIRPSVPLYAADLRTASLTALNVQALEATKVVRLTQAREGLAVSLVARKAFDWTNPYMRLRDGCVRVWVPSADASSRISLTLRYQQVGAAQSQYAFSVHVGRREACLVRMISAELGKPSTFVHITPWQVHPALARLGPASVFEFRAQGAMLEGRVDGERVAVAHDAILGIGRAGLRLEAGDGPAQIVLAGLEIAGVVA